MIYFLQNIVFQNQGEDSCRKKKKADEIVYIIFMYYFGTLGKKVKFMILKIGSILKITHYFIPLNIKSTPLKCTLFFFLMKMNTICDIMVMFGEKYFFKFLGSSVKEK